MRKIFIFIVFIFCLCLAIFSTQGLTGCGRVATTTTSNSTSTSSSTSTTSSSTTTTTYINYYPNAQGIKWSYFDLGSSSTPPYAITTLESGIIENITITGVPTTNARVLTETLDDNSGNIKRYKHYYSATNTGVFEITSMEVESATYAYFPFKLIQYPLTTGESWIATNGTYGGFTVIGTATAIGIEPIIVPLSTSAYNAFKIQLDIRNITQAINITIYYWMVENMGTVKRVVIQNDVSTRELIGFTPAP